LSPDVVRIRPWYFTNPLRSMLFYHHITNSWKVRGLLRRLGVSTENWCLNAYAVYVVCGAIFHKDYWLDVSSGSGNDVNEEGQLIRAVEWARRHRDATFARAASDCVVTTFRSSASSRTLDEKVGFDMMLF